MTNLWISGSTGFIGKHLQNYLSTFYDNIICISHNDKTLFLNDENHYTLNFLKYSEIESLISKIGKPDIFIHLGWGDMHDSSSSVHLQENVQASKNLLDCFFEHGIQKFIFIGSVDEYGNKNRLLSESTIPEGTLTPYAEGKRLVANYGFEKQKSSNQFFVHIRLCNTYGIGQKPSSLVNYLYNSTLTSRKAFVHPGNIFRDYIHISEVIHGIKLLLELNQSITVNLGSGKMISLQDFILEFWSQLKQKNENIVFESSFDPNNIPFDSRVDLSLLQKLTNWVPSLSLEDGVHLTLQDMFLK